MACFKAKFSVVTYTLPNDIEIVMLNNVELLILLLPILLLLILLLLILLLPILLLFVPTF